MKYKEGDLILNNYGEVYQIGSLDDLSASYIVTQVNSSGPEAPYAMSEWFAVEHTKLYEPEPLDPRVLDMIEEYRRG